METSKLDCVSFLEQDGIYIKWLALPSIQELALLWTPLHSDHTYLLQKFGNPHDCIALLLFLPLYTGSSNVRAKRTKRISKDDSAVANFDSPLEGSDDIPALGQDPGQIVDAGSGEYVHVAFTSDENTLIGTVAAVNSIWKNSKHRVKFLLVTNDKAYPILKWESVCDHTIWHIALYVYSEEWASSTCSCCLEFTHHK